jgi:AcrR family transcriptional regulator
MSIHYEAAMRAARTDSETRRQQIAEAAFMLVAAHGARELSLAAVARRVGLVPSALYRHFPDKDALLDAILNRVRARLAQHLAVVREHPQEPIEALRALLARHAAMIRENQGIPRILFAEDFFVHSPKRRTEALSILNSYLEGIADLVRAGQARGQIRSDIDPRTLSLMFLGLIQPAGALWILSDGDFDVTAHVKRAWKLYHAAIAPDPPGAEPRGRPRGGREDHKAARSPEAHAPKRRQMRRVSRTRTSPKGPGDSRPAGGR